MIKITVLALAAILVGMNAPRAQTRYVVGVENISYMPHYTYEDGEFGGAARAILDAFAKDKGYVFDYEALPVQRLYAHFLNGKVDFKFPDAPEWKQDLKSGATITYSAPVLNYVDGTLVLPSVVGRGKGAVATIGTVAGFTPWAWIEDVRSGRPELAENGSLEALVNQALAGRVDAVYANVDVVAYLLRDALKRPNALVFDTGLPFVRGRYHLSTLKHADVIAEFDAWIQANGPRMEAIRREFGIQEKE